MSWVGEPSNEYRAVCEYSPKLGAKKCNLPSTVHVMVDDPKYGRIALQSCSNHVSHARAAGRYVMEHKREGVCCLPGTLWLYKENVCVLDISGVEPELVGAIGGSI